MAVQPQAPTGIHAWLYALRIRLMLLHRNWVAFGCELRSYPLTMIGGGVILMYIAGAIFAPWITAHNPERGELTLMFTPPAWEAGGTWTYPLGTDGQGRDILTRLIFGARISLLVGLIAVAVSAVVGVALGAAAGYFRGHFDNLISRFADLLMAFPFLIFAIFVMAFLGPGFVNLILALTFKGWVEFFRLARGETMTEKTKEYVEAARAAGQDHIAIIAREILPNIVQSVFVLGTLRLGYFIIMEASLSFLGLGIQPPTPAWGTMVADGQDAMLFAWWVATMPGLAILGLVLAINVFGEGVRDIIDPRLKVE